MVLGPNPAWERALNVEVNALLREPTSRPLPESVAVYLWCRAGREPGAPSARPWGARGIFLKRDSDR